MAYEGDYIEHCMGFNFKRSYAVVVSGSTFNPCGHLLLNVGGLGGWYFHIGAKKWPDRPRFMDENGYKRYLKDNKKKELSRTFVKLPNPDDSNSKLEELLGKQWVWFILPHNCASFVEDVLQAGGTSAGLYFNCPSREIFN